MTFAEEIARENELAQRWFIHATRPRRLMSLKEALELCRRIDRVGKEPILGEIHTHSGG